jgi:hypothetical protein
MVFNKLEYNREYSKSYYLKQKLIKFGNNKINNNIMEELTKVKKPIGNLAIQRQRIERELRKNQAKIDAYNAKQEKEQEKEKETK